MRSNKHTHIHFAVCGSRNGYRAVREYRAVKEYRAVRE